MRVRALLADFYGTLAEAAGTGPRWADVLARHGYDLPEEVRRRHSDDHFDGIEHVEHSRSRRHYVDWQRARLRAMVLDCGVGADDADRVVDDLHESGRAFAMRAYPEVPEVLAELRARGVIVAVCSNWDWDLDRSLEQAGLTELVDVQVTSARAGARKPHRRIFDHTLEAVGVAPGEALFVGDTWRADVEGPRAAGIPAVHIWRERRAAPPPPLTDGVRRITDLRGLLEFLQ